MKKSECIKYDNDCRRCMYHDSNQKGFCCTCADVWWDQRGELDVNHNCQNCRFTYEWQCPYYSPSTVNGSPNHKNI